MNRNRLIFMLVVAVIGSCHLFGEEIDTLSRTKNYFRDHVKVGLDYTTELQTDFRNVNWVNQLHLTLDWQFCDWLSLQAGTYSVAKTREEALIEDLQGFSNIEADNMPLALAVCGLSFEWKSGSVFVGVNNINEHYFTTPITSLFTGSSPGIFPPVSAELPIANYPFSSLGVHLHQQYKGFFFQACLYNGRGYSGWRKSDNPFIVKPKRDGLFAVMALNYEHKDSYYTLGTSLYSGVPEEVKWQTVSALWVNVEQRLSDHFHLLAQAGVNISVLAGLSDMPFLCRHYEALGLTACYGRTNTGLIFNYADFTHVKECAAELTCQVTITPSLTIQPSIHFVRTNKEINCVGLLRLNYSI